jgi:two-component system phosphate regulon sensor histidine kinase PhoR
MTRRLNNSLGELDQTRARLEATLASLTDGVVITDARGAVIRLNGAARHMLGRPDLTPGQPFVQVARDHELAALLRQALASPPGTPRTITVEHGRSGLILEATAQRLTGASEQLGLVVLRDITELRRLEGVRREFVANVSHELRTPLASIKALVETLEVGAIDDPLVAHDFLTRIIAEVDRLAALVDELLDLARLESGRVTLQLEALNPSDVLTAGIDRLRPQIERAHLNVRVDLPETLPRVRGDRARIEQVLLNLVHNAIKFTPPGGTITVSAAAANGDLRVAVHDTGVGVAPEELPRLFERFYKTDKARHSKGTGLGLAIAKHIVQAHGGTIWAESVPGEGATFFFTLHLADAAGASSAAVDSSLTA